MDRKACPKCNSHRVWIGVMNRVLECISCGWNYLNEYGCDLCDQPASSAMAADGPIWYRCKDHPFTEAEKAECMKRFMASVDRAEKEDKLEGWT